jgi:hypothetical protein
VAGAAEIRGIDKDWIDHERLRVVELTNLEGNR